MLAVWLPVLLVATIGLPATSGEVRQGVAAGAPLTPAQTLAIRQPGDLQWSPDGTRIAFTVTEPPEGAERNRDIWLLDARSRSVRQLTSSQKGEWSPRWSPDGRVLAFLSDRDGGTQIFLLSMDGGEGMRLTDGKNGVTSFDWAPDGSQLAFLAAEPRTDADEKRDKDKDDARVIDRDERLARVWTVDVATKRVTQLTRGRWRVNEAKWVRGANRLVVSATEHPESTQETNQIYLLDPSDPELRLVTAPRGPFSNLSPSPDGRRLAYLGSRVDGPSTHDQHVCDLTERATPHNLTAGPIDRAVSGFSWREDGSILATVQDGFKTRLYALGASGQATGVPAISVNPSAISVNGAGTLAFLGLTTTTLPEVWLWTPAGGRPEPVTGFNAALASWRLVPLETFRYRSFDGVEVEGGLLRPSAAAVKGPAPLVVVVHGGPTGRWWDTFEPWGQLLAARGYAVFYPNPRGSTGYGHRFVDMNRADWGGGDFKDIMGGVDVLVKQGVADPERLGIGGWSYGGYMAAWAITQTTRFKASVIGAGLSDLASEFGTESSPAYDEWFFGVPYEHLDVFQRCSPITYIKNAKTPSLILHGEADTTDPIGQSQQLYRGLKQYGVPSQFVVYPREGHSMREEKHLIDRLSRMLGWFDKYLAKPGTPSLAFR